MTKKALDAGFSPAIKAHNAPEGGRFQLKAGSSFGCGHSKQDLRQIMSSPMEISQSLRGWSRLVFRIWVVQAMAFWIPAATLAAAAPKRPQFVEDEVLVRFRDGIAEQAKALAHARVAGKRLKEFKIVKGLERVKLPPPVTVEEAVRLYRQNPNVLYAEPNYIAKTQGIPNDPSYGAQWGLQKINASGAWDLSLGSSSVVVTALDTGVDYKHQDLSGNIWRNSLDCNNNGIDDDGNGHVDDCYGIDTYNNDSDPFDDETISHGTHVAGIIGAVGNNAIGTVGVNWNVSVMACKFIGAAGTGPISAAIECMEYVKLMKERGVNIVAANASYLGSFSQAEFDAVAALKQVGVLFLACAGNDGIDNDLSSPQYPASYFLPNVISVAGTDPNDNLGFFPISQDPKSSNYGKRTVHLGAPGTAILSTTRGDT